MKSAESYIIFPLDVPTVDDAVSCVRRLSGHVGMFKVGLELFIAAGPDIITCIRDESDASIFLDLKLHDIPETVKRAMQRISGWGVTFTTVHCGESRAMLDAAVAGGGSTAGVLGVTVLTSVSAEDIRQAGFQAAYTENLPELVLMRAKMARESGCVGVVCSGREVAMIKTHLGPDFVAVTPGIRPAWEGGAKDDQKRVMTPAEAIARGSDYLVIGRPIRDAKDPVAAARRIAEEIEAALADR